MDDPGWGWSNVIPAALAGAAGGVVRALTLRVTPLEMASGVVVGAICSIYLGPVANPIIEKIGFAPDQTGHLAGFVIGLGGIAVSGFVMDFWRGLRRARGDKR